MAVKLEMEMPSKCKECELAVRFQRYSNEPPEYFCGYTKDDVNMLWSKRPEFCPLEDANDQA